MSYTLLEKLQPQARKNYRCIWCLELILKGDVHVYEVSIYVGNFQRHRWHTECYAAAQLNFANGDDEEFEAHACRRGTTEEA